MRIWTAAHSKLLCRCDLPLEMEKTFTINCNKNSNIQTNTARKIHAKIHFHNLDYSLFKQIKRAKRIKWARISENTNKSNSNISSSNSRKKTRETKKKKKKKWNPNMNNKRTHLMRSWQCAVSKYGHIRFCFSLWHIFYCISIILLGHTTLAHRCLWLSSCWKSERQRAKEGGWWWRENEIDR